MAAIIYIGFICFVLGIFEIVLNVCGEMKQIIRMRFVDFLLARGKHVI
jgi:hypothetical protein